MIKVSLIRGGTYISATIVTKKVTKPGSLSLPPSVGGTSTSLLIPIIGEQKEVLVPPTEMVISQAEQAMLLSRQTERDYYLPEDSTDLLDMLLKNSHLYQPTNILAETNLKTLVKAYNGNGDWLKTLIDPYIQSACEAVNASSLARWRALLVKIDAKELIDDIDELIIDIMSKLNLVKDLDHDIFAEAEKLFKNPSKRRGRDSILTEVRINSTISDEICKNLGTKYDVYKMIESKNYNITGMLAQIHRDILQVLQDHGFPGVGLPGQTFSNTPWSNAKTLAFIQNPSFTPTSQVIKQKRGIVTEPVTKVSPFDSLMSSLIKVVEYYAEQQAAIKSQPPVGVVIPSMAEGLKLFKNLLSLGTQDSYNKLSRWITTCLLTKNKYTEYYGDEERLIKLKKTFEDKLDDWQDRMITSVRDGKSVMAITPTSAGKTYTAMSSIEWKLETSRESKRKIILGYIAPSFDLAFQTYNNIRKTFPRYKVSLVTSRASEINSGTEIWIGTPIELWNYFKVMDLNFDIAYFDEIHIVSLSFGTARESQLRSEALGNLLTRCKEQIICLSATIHDADIPILCNFISEHSGINIDPIDDVIIHRNRPIPQVKLQWDGDMYRSERDECVVCDVTPESTFAFLHQIVHEEHAPALIFDDSAENCWKNYEAYIGWLIKSERRDYAGWHNVNESMKQSIHSFNDSVDSYNKRLSEAMGSGKDKQVETVKRDAGKFGSTKLKLLQDIIIAIEKEIFRDMSSIQNGSYKGYTRPIIKKHSEFLTRRGYKGVFEGMKVPVEIADLIEAYENTEKSKRTTGGDDASGIAMICDDIGSYFRIGDKCRQIDDLRAMFDPKLDPYKGMKLRNEMLTLCEAERIRESEIEPLFDLIVKGLDFGVGIILPTVPFVVHYNMLKLLNTKLIPIVFASQEMSMGINYPIRLVCIRANKPIEMNVCEYLQMAGRSGRRRHDTIGYIVSWNIMNSFTASQDTLPRIVLPRVDGTGGSQIANPLELAMEIERGRVYSVNSETGISTLNDAIGRLGYSHAPKSKSSGVSVSFDDDDSLPIPEDDDDTHLRRRGNVVVAPTKMYAQVDDDALISAIGGCIAPLTEAMSMEASDLLQIADRIKNITLGYVSEDLTVDAFKWAMKIGLVKIALQELHTKMHTCSHEVWLKYIESTYELIHRVQIRHMKLSK